MPSLKDLVCVVQWANTGSPFPEYGTQYGDGVVETYIAIPSHPQAFTIRLTSRKFICEGISMVVFIDGNYQCNRNRVNLQPYKKNLPKNRYEVDFIVRQKEKPMGDGTYMGREWRFDDHNIGLTALISSAHPSANLHITVPDLPRGVNQSHFDELGTIEVLVLRCQTGNPTESQMSSSSSGEDSLFITGDANPTGEQESDYDPKNEPSTDSHQPQPEEDGLGAMFGLFDGPSDYPPGYYGRQSTPPPNGYQSWNWQAPDGQYGPRHPQRPLGPPYPPQQGPSHPQHYRPGPEPINLQHQHSFVRERPPPHAQMYGLSKPERRVHFDYGDSRNLHGHNHGRHDHFPLHSDQPTWRRNPSYFHARASSEYQDPEVHPRGPNAYADYAVPAPDAHHMYNVENYAYHGYPDHSQIHGNYQQQDPSGHIPSHYPSHSGQPAQQPIQPFGQQPAFANQPPGPARFPIQPVSWVAGQPQFPSQPVSVIFPPNLIPVPHPVPGVQIYPPPSAAPFYHLPTTASASNLMPQATPAPPLFQASDQQNSMQQTTNADPAKDQNNPAPNVNTNPSDFNNKPSAGSTNWTTGGDTGGDTNNGAGDAGNWNNDTNNTGDNVNTSNNDEWANSGANNTAGNGASGNDWNNSTPNNTGAWQNHDNNNQNNSGNSWDNNNDASQNNNGSGWDNKNDVNQNNSGSGGGGGGGGWNDNNESNNTQPGNWNNDQTNNTNANTNDTPTPAMPAKRPLYGPHGAYFTSKAFGDPEVPADAEEEPRYDVPQAIAQSKGTSKQVQPGTGYIYNKKRCAPRYIDTMDEPYARFVFKYRTKEQIKNETGIEIAAEPTSNEDINALEQLDKTELIQMVIRAKGALGGEIPAPLPKDTAAQTPTPSFEQVLVAPPETTFLKYNLPPGRAVSFPGLGIRHSVNNPTNDNTNNKQENSWNNNQQTSGDQNWGSSGNNNTTSGDDWNKNNAGGGAGWNDNTQNNTSGAGWNNPQNNNAASGTGAGWDGQQESNNSAAKNGNQGIGSTQTPGSGKMRTPQQQQKQNNSQGNSAINAQNQMNSNGNNTQAADPELAAYIGQAAHMGGQSGPNPDWTTPAAPAAGPQQPWQNQTQQPQQQAFVGGGGGGGVGSGIQTIGTGFVGGGGGATTTTSLNFNDKPPTPPLKPCSPDTVNNGEWPMGPPPPEQTQFGAGPTQFSNQAPAAPPGGSAFW